ncbi:MAG: hypothetical protein Fur0037_05430 [Planctomycetota bacterium]
MNKRIAAILFPLCSAAIGQQFVTAPAAYDAQDAPSRLWLAGVSADLRQQIVIDGRHLAAAAGRSLTAISFRREAANEAYGSGTVDLTVALAVNPLIDALSATADFASNLGPNPTVVHQGAIAIPAAPPMPASGATWSPATTIRIPFSQPFAYSGGTLVIDLRGRTTAQSVAWWPCDAAADPVTGSVQNVGTGCGSHANAAGEWASAADNTLVPGATAQFYALGTEQGLGLMLFGLPASMPGTPLSLMIPGAIPGCTIYMQPPVTPLFAAFSTVPFPGEWGLAQIWLPIPNAAWILGASFGSQWMDLQQGFATSNGLVCTIAGAAPSLGMAEVRGGAQAATGAVLTNLAHVVRFEFQ